MTSFSRRDFLKSSSIALAGSAFALDRLAEIALEAERANVKHLGVQLWSVRDDMKNNAKGTIEALGKMGYKEVEGFGYDPATSQIFGMHLKDFGNLLQDNGLSMPSSHIGFSMESWDSAKKELTDATKKSINAAAQAGQKYVICPQIGDNECANIATMVKVFQAAGEYARKQGIKFGYHNHDFEFLTFVEGRSIYDWLLKEVSPKAMTMEMDIYWVKFANEDPLSLIRKNPGRFELCHVKDMSKGPNRETIEVGDGAISFRDIFKERVKAGFKYYIVELEHYATTPLKGVEKSRDYFVNKLKF